MHLILGGEEYHWNICPCCRRPFFALKRNPNNLDNADKLQCWKRVSLSNTGVSETDWKQFVTSASCVNSSHLPAFAVALFFTCVGQVSCLPCTCWLSCLCVNQTRGNHYQLINLWNIYGLHFIVGFRLDQLWMADVKDLQQHWNPHSSVDNRLITVKTKDSTRPGYNLGQFFARYILGRCHTEMTRSVTFLGPLFLVRMTWVQIALQYWILRILRKRQWEWRRISSILFWSVENC